MYYKVMSVATSIRDSVSSTDLFENNGQLQHCTAVRLSERVLIRVIHNF